MPDGCPNHKSPPPCFKELLGCAAAFFNNRLDHSGKAHPVQWRLTDGTLLGQRRHNGHFIPWDDDIDVSVDTRGNGNQLDYSMIESFQTFKKSTHKEKDACAKVTHMEKISSGNLRLIHKDCIHCNYGKLQHLDITNDSWSVIHESGDRKKIGDDPSITYPYKECTLEGIKCSCPNQTDKYLDLYYGQWKTPTYSTFNEKSGKWEGGQPQKGK